MDNLQTGYGVNQNRKKKEDEELMPNQLGRTYAGDAALGYNPKRTYNQDSVSYDFGGQGSAQYFPGTGTRGTFARQDAGTQGQQDTTQGNAPVNPYVPRGAQNVGNGNFYRGGYINTNYDVKGSDAAKSAFFRPVAMPRAVAGADVSDIRRRYSQWLSDSRNTQMPEAPKAGWQTANAVYANQMNFLNNRLQAQEHAGLERGRLANMAEQNALQAQLGYDKAQRDALTEQDKQRLEWAKLGAQQENTQLDAMTKQVNLANKLQERELVQALSQEKDPARKQRLQENLRMLRGEAQKEGDKGNYATRINSDGVQENIQLFPDGTFRVMTEQAGGQSLSQDDAKFLAGSAQDQQDYLAHLDKTDQAKAARLRELQKKYSK